MRIKILILFSALFLILLALLSAARAEAAGPSHGVLYHYIQGPITATPVAIGEREGRATCHTVLGMVSWGDCSVRRAAEEGAVKEISTVDYRSWGIYILYQNYQTRVSGQ